MIPARHPWSPPNPTFRQRLHAAAVRAIVWSFVIAVAFALLALSASAAGGAFDPARIALNALILNAILFALLAPTMLLLSTRAMQDRVFTAAGCVATFFGLGFLLIFFALLIFGSWIGFGVIDIGRGSGAVEWFEFAPQLIADENQRLLDAPLQFERTELDKLERERQDEIGRAEQEAEEEPGFNDLTLPEQAAARRAARGLVNQLFNEGVIPERKKELAPTLAEKRRAAQRVRPETSAPALLGHFLTSEPSNDPQDAGIRPALLGSVYVGIITMLFAVTVGVGAAIYLEEYRANSWLSRLIQVNINNLAGVPSVVYGILGGFVFVELIFKPLHQQLGWIAARNVLGGGLTLGLLTLPIVIVSAQEAIRAVPGSIRHGAFALGATKWQTIWRTVLPMALPGILTGTILALSRAIGEAAPLVLFGASALVTYNPSLFTPFTVLPMQIFGWADRPPITLPDGESIDFWKGNAAMASIVLLAALLMMNGIAIYLRNRTQRRTGY